MIDHVQNIQDWATGEAGEGEPALPLLDIQANIENYVSQLGTLTYFEADIPDTATARPNGVFLDADDLYQYLESGGLVLLNPDTGEPVPNPIVHIYRWADDEDGHYEYEVWIDENS